MLRSYADYRKWWKIAHDMANTNTPVQSGETFEEHINSMTLFELMELLEGWGYGREPRTGRPR